MIHDIIPEQFPKLIFTSNKHCFFWNLKLWAASKQADVILTVSEFSKRGIIEHFGIHEGRVRVITEAADRIFHPVCESLWVDELCSFQRLRRLYELNLGRFLQLDFSVYILLLSRVHSFCENPGSRSRSFGRVTGCF